MSCSLCLLCNATHRALGRRWLFDIGPCLTPVRAFLASPCAESCRDGDMDRRRSQPASEDSEDADTSSRDAEAWHDARVRGGVIRQSLPNALQHQVEAAQLAANKRQAEAADPAEQRAKRAAAEQVRRDRDDMSEDEWQAFTAWREEFGNVDLHLTVYRNG